MTDYSKFDAALLTEIRVSPQAMRDLLRTPQLLGLASECVDSPVREIVARVFDRRLQALRRAGKIRYTGKVWEACSDRQ